MSSKLPFEITREVRERCLCLHLHQATRVTARHFDEALRPLGLNNCQYSLLMSVNRPEPPGVGELADFLAMDRTTLTANLKPLERRRLLEVVRDEGDRRRRHIRLTAAGHEMLIKAVPVWRTAHDELDLIAARSEQHALRAMLNALAASA